MEGTSNHTAGATHRFLRQGLRSHHAQLNSRLTSPVLSVTDDLEVITGDTKRYNFSGAFTPFFINSARFQLFSVPF